MLFIAKAQETLGDKRDYSNVNYINSHTHIKTICKGHGVFEQMPAMHISKSGCPKCVNKAEAKLCEATKQVYPTLITQFKQVLNSHSFHHVFFALYL